MNVDAGRKIAHISHPPPFRRVTKNERLTDSSIMYQLIVLENFKKTLVSKPDLFQIRHTSEQPTGDMET